MAGCARLELCFVKSAMLNNGFIVIAKIFKCIDDRQHFHSKFGQSIFYFGWILMIIMPICEAICNHLS